MRIGIDARLVQWPGIGRYIREIIRRLPRLGSGHRFIVFCSPQHRSVLESFATGLPNLRIVADAPPVFTLVEQVAWPRVLRNHPVDLFFSPHLVVPLLSRTPVAITVHDLLWMAFPEHASSGLARFYFSLMIRLAVRKARCVVADSDFTKREINRLMGVPLHRVKVVRLGSSFLDRDGQGTSEPHPRKVLVEGKYILYVGTLKAWKNVPTLVRAFALLERKFPDVKLVMVGKRATYKEVDVAVVTEQLRLKEKILLLNEVSEFDLETLYRGCLVLVCPSFYEGFGLTGLEGISLGCPVVATRIPVHEEVLGDCALFCDPFDPTDIADKISTFLRSPELRREYGNRGIRRASMFSWETCARNLLETLSSSHAEALPQVS